MDDDGGCWGGGGVNCKMINGGNKANGLNKSTDENLEVSRSTLIGLDILH